MIATSMSLAGNAKTTANYLRRSDDPRSIGHINSVSTDLRVSLFRIAVELRPRITRSAALASILGSVVNALYRGEFGVDVSAIARFSPWQDHSEYIDPLRECRICDHQLLREKLADFVVTLGYARQATIECFLAGRLRPGEIEQSSFSALAEAWQDTCLSASHLLQAIDSTTRYLISAHAENTTTTPIEVLEEVHNGGSPLVMSDGRVTMPAWAEQRRAARVSVDIEIMLLTQEGRQAANATDISEFGVGVVGASGLQIGKPVTVRFGASLEVGGHVIWSNGDRVGIEFASEA